MGVILAALCAAWLELKRRDDPVERVAGLFDWFSKMLLDSSPFLVLLALLPIFWLIRSAGPLERERTGWRYRWELWFGRSTNPGVNPIDWRGKLRVATLAALVGCVSIGCSWSIANKVVRTRPDVRFGELPPAYHDEYSYLLQARTFLAGRLSFPSHPTQAEVFEQPHVVNEGRYASRYFPATGAWIALFLQFGQPDWGHWIAGALTAALIFAAGRELGGNGTGFTAGLLTAMSPGMAVFSNLLLAHHPAMLGLAFFLWAFLKMLRTMNWWLTFFAGCGLTFAMLARPMTAAGFGFPFGVWFVVWLFRRNDNGAQQAAWRFRITRVVAMGVPILAGFAFLMVFNKAITGDPLRTPYDLYTETYTPRHAYGFNNVTRAEERIAAGTALTKTTFENYDKWAENLTPALALENVGKRLRASWQWTLGIVPMLIAVCVFLSSRHGDESRWWLIPAAIMSLHLAHVPYWYAGIAHWHYVFESGPLWLLLFARSTQLLFRLWRESRRGWLPLWWCALILVSLATAYLSDTPFWSQGRVDREVGNITFSRWKYRKFREMVDREVTEPKALILIEHDPADRHIDFVSNASNLQGEQRLLFGRYLPEKMDLDAIAAAFPDRACYLYRVRQRRLLRFSSE